ncbi:MAG: hypothetical protein B7X04_03280 [Parcubacteria group bacterium 21-54-25]|nr:MAG: hypothetical protein B7X04_03280 [Parcubacteria group bacterium 21-54-25]HQU08047.1 hypothetical protein [Candidatus Paceibacterota bacterium]
MKTFKKSSFTKKSRGGFSRDSAPQERFQATCNECRAVCEVPFKPNGKKPVYCRDCFKGKEEAPSFSRSPRRTYGDRATSTDQFEMLGAKIDRLTAAVEAQTRVLSAPRR